MSHLNVVICVDNINDFGHSFIWHFQRKGATTPLSLANSISVEIQTVVRLAFPINNVALTSCPIRLSFYLCQGYVYNCLTKAKRDTRYFQKTCTNEKCFEIVYSCILDYV